MNNGIIEKAFFLPRLCGCFPFYFRNGKTEFDCKSIAYVVIIKTLFFFEPIVHFNRLPYSGITGMVFDKLFASGFYLVLSTTNLLSCIQIVLQRRKIEMLFSNYERANFEILNLGYKPHFDLNLIRDLLMMTLPCTSIVRMFSSGKKHHFYHTLIFILYSNWSLYMTVQPFIRILDNLRFRLKFTNRILYALNYKRNGSFNSVLILFALLCYTCELLNEVFSLQLLFAISVSFFGIVARIYYCIRVSQQSIFGFFLYSVMLIFYSAICCLVATVCKKTSDEVSLKPRILY